MDFKNELAKYGYNINNSIPVETLVNEILPKLFSVQDERMYSDKEVLELLCKREWCYEHTIPFISVDDWFEQNKKK